MDQGLLGYEDRISQHWPQFQGGGKEEVTVADLMRHEVLELQTKVKRKFAKISQSQTEKAPTRAFF